MRTSSTTRARSLAAAAMLCLGCGGAEAGSVAPPPVAVDPPSLSIEAAVGDPVIAIGDSLFFRAVAKDRAGNVIEPAALQWSAVGVGRVALTPASGVLPGSGVALVVPQSVGEVELRVSLGRASALYRFEVLASRPQLVPVDSSPVIVEDAHLLLFGGGRSFVPNMLLRSRDGRPVLLLGFKLVIPGYSPVRYCRTSVAEAVGTEVRPLIFASYGDWDLVFSAAETVPTSAPAVVLLYVSDGPGEPIVVRVPMVFTAEPRPMISSSGTSAGWSC